MTGGMTLEIGLGVLILLVFVVGLSWRGQDKRRLGVLVAIGLSVLLWMAFRVEPGAVLFRGTFVQDELAIFAKRLFLLATILGVDFDPNTSYDERKDIWRMSDKIVITRNITQSAIGDRDGLWTSVVAAAVFVE